MRLLPFPFITLLLLGACNPEHNPHDVGEIEALRRQVSDVQSELAEERTVEAEDRATADRHRFEDSALYVIAEAYVNLAKSEGAGMTVCFGEQQGAGWIQAVGDTADCTYPVLFELERDEATGHITFDPNGD